MGQLRHLGVLSLVSLLALIFMHCPDHSRQFLEVIRQDTPQLSAAELVPTAFSGACAAITTGVLIGRLQPGWIMLISMTAFCVGTILLATNPPHRTYWAQIFVSTIITTWGMVRVHGLEPLSSYFRG